MVAGIDALEPGYKKIKIAPHPGGGLQWVNASYQCEYGKIISNWKIEKGILVMNVTIPKSTTAEIHLPNGKIVQVGSGSYQYKMSNDKQK